jgi:DNA-binding GntR family transcriptional regulator
MLGENGPQNLQLRQWVADRLRSEILEGKLCPGEWLRQERLSREHGVSQTPVREALKLLASEGLVEHVPYRGVRVVELCREDVEDLYATRSVIEGRAARFAAERISRAEVEELESLHRQMMACVTPRDLAKYRELNRQFHTLIFKVSRRSHLVRTLAHLWAAFPTMLWSTVPRVATESAPGRDQPDTMEHAEIVAAMRARNPDRAERALRAHIEAAGAALLAAMESKP